MKLIQIGYRQIKQTTVELRDDNNKTWFMFVTNVPGESVSVKPSSFCEKEFKELSPIKKNNICSAAIKFATK